MGGTLGCIGEPLSPMPATQFIPQLQQIFAQDHAITCFVAPVIKDSSACTAEDWLKLVEFIQSLQATFKHFVIIHGTDTLSYASAVLAQLLGRSAHVVCTGSQYPLLNITGTKIRDQSDAYANLNFALTAVITQPKGVYLAFHQRLIHAQTALKQHTTQLDAFTGIEVDTILQQHAQAMLIHAEHIHKAKTFNCVSLMLQPIQIACHIAFLTAIIAQPPTVLILQGFGTGNIAVNPELLQILQKIRDQNCAVIISSQVPFGDLDQRYAISNWIQHANFLVDNSYSHADLYAKTLKMYLKYDTVDQWDQHWHDNV